MSFGIAVLAPRYATVTKSSDVNTATGMLWKRATTAAVSGARKNGKIAPVADSGRRRSERRRRR